MPIMFTMYIHTFVIFRLLRYNQAVDDLLKFDDLSLLFSAISSPCPTHNKIWRKASAETLMTICKHNLTSKCPCTWIICSGYNYVVLVGYCIPIS